MTELTDEELFNQAITAAAAELPDVPSEQIAAALEAASAVYAAHSDAEDERLVAETGILDMHVGAGEFKASLTMAVGVAAGLVQAAKAFLASTNAENYVEQQVIDRETGNAYLLTIQRRERPTPHELRRRAEARVAELEEELAQLRARLQPTDNL